MEEHFSEEGKPPNDFWANFRRVHIRISNMYVSSTNLFHIAAVLVLLGFLEENKWKVIYPSLVLVLVDATDTILREMIWSELLQRCVMNTFFIFVSYLWRNISSTQLVLKGKILYLTEWKTDCSWVINLQNKRVSLVKCRKMKRKTKWTKRRFQQ